MADWAPHDVSAYHRMLEALAQCARRLKSAVPRDAHFMLVLTRRNVDGTLRVVASGTMPEPEAREAMSQMLADKRSNALVYEPKGN